MQSSKAKCCPMRTLKPNLRILPGMKKCKGSSRMYVLAFWSILYQALGLYSLRHSKRHQAGAQTEYVHSVQEFRVKKEIQSELFINENQKLNLNQYNHYMAVLWQNLPALRPGPRGHILREKKMFKYYISKISKVYLSRQALSKHKHKALGI